MLRRWEEEGRPPVRVGINLSLAQLANADFLTRAASCLGLSGLAPNRLEFEIPHDVLARDLDHSRLLVSRLRDIGVGVAVDNFGAAPASLSGLERSGRIDHAVQVKGLPRRLATAPSAAT